MFLRESQIRDSCLFEVFQRDGARCGGSQCHPGELSEGCSRKVMSSVPTWGYSVKQWEAGEGGAAPYTLRRTLMEGLLCLGPDIF